MRNINLGAFLFWNGDFLITIKFNNWEKYNKRQKDIRNPFWFSMSNNFFYDPEFYDFNSDEKCTLFYLLAEASRNGCYGEFNITEQHYSRITSYSKHTLYNTLDKLLKLKVAAVSRQDGGGNPASTEQNKTEQNKTEYSLGEKSPVNDFDLEFIYKSYPKRLGDQRKKVGMARLKRLVKSQVDYDLAIKAVTNYYAMQQKNGKIGSEYIKQFGTFWDSYGDWVEWANIQSDESLKSNWKAKMMERLK